MGVRASEEGCLSIGVPLSLEGPLQRGKLAFKERERETVGTGRTFRMTCLQKCRRNMEQRRLLSEIREVMT